MRMIGPWALALLALAAPGWSGDIYRWTDDAGHVHYSNMDAEGAGATAPGDAVSFSADASLRRNALERDLRATQQRLREIDARLALLAQARTQHTQGSAATGGVGTPTV